MNEEPDRREQSETNRKIRRWAAARNIRCPVHGPIPTFVRRLWEQDQESQPAASGGRWVETNSGPPFKAK